MMWMGAVVNDVGCKLPGPGVADILEHGHVVGNELWLLNYLFSLVFIPVWPKPQSSVLCHSGGTCCWLWATTVIDRQNVLSCCIECVPLLTY